MADETPSEAQAKALEWGLTEATTATLRAMVHRGWVTLMIEVVGNLVLRRYEINDAGRSALARYREAQAE